MQKRRLAAMTAAMVAILMTSWAQAHDAHQAHHDMMAKGAAVGYKVSHARYTVPDITLVSSTGAPVRLQALLQEPRPVLLQFIYTTCTTICPVLSATFSQAQARLAAQHADYRMVSISIDPEYDTPQKLASYAQRYQASPQWTFLTGKASDIQATLRAFESIYPSFNKMNHEPATFLKVGSGARWERIDGFVSVDELMREYAGLMRSGKSLAQ
ncbi:MAG: SCO family protein [Burkholderiaceae bacterium]|nr:SCO family protein [Burkholderiaceae bacterium]MDZ4144464.1 SCO family protein [Burkholderiales bacterium]